ncbi:hypothetical protein [Clostridium butyricum]|uniref:hypothetical protein n=1 Tax=Clostridium butyricum TaxID=1492 RepID=UPI0005EB9D22|nr:hypothetical protein [Clostridium butyricum]MCQ2019646.1 hypothetical protein [Clostridium butyricum]MCQ2021198.1 hypothetical protein [Clostridium butyricum]NFB72673.1 hypothetical protein [Clostridium butyricum]NFB91465.1 hypothetical protein [Clostridium butyricum]UTY53497.1 hypothetical protein HNS01_10490 [Clostridium butyricum]
MNEKKVLKWIEVSWMVSMGLGMLFLGVYGLWLSRSIRYDLSGMLIQSIGGIILAAVYFIFGSIFNKTHSVLSATVLFVVTILDTCYRIYLGVVLGSVIFVACTFVLFKGLQGARYLQNKS